MALQLRRGTEAERTAGGGIVFAEGELVYITDTEEVYVGDGVTPGGIRVTGSIVGSPAQLTQNLSLNSYNINGNGNININGTITASNFSGGGSGIIDGQEYVIDIQGDVRGFDSSIIVDSTTGIVYADFVGDGSLITGISVSSLEDTNIVSALPGQMLMWNGSRWINETITQLIEGQTYNIGVSGNIVSNGDSSVILDTATNIGTFVRTFAESSILRVDGDYGTLNMRKTVSVDLTGSNDILGGIYFDKDDINGVGNTAFIVGAESYIAMAVNSTGTMVEADHVLLSTNGLGIGTYSPGAKLDVRGTGAFTGDLTLSSASLKLSDLRAYTDITSPTNGEVMYDNVQSTLLFRSTSGWNKVIYSEVNSLLTQVPGPVVMGGVTNADLVAADDSAITGLMAYDSDNDRFTFYQAGSFVNLPNNGNTIGEVLKWNGTEWAASPDVGGSPGSNADLLDGLDSPYFLDYNNFTNTPTISAFGLTLIDDADAAAARTTLGLGTAATTASTDYATAAQGATADTALQPADLGNFTFTGSVLDSSDSSAITVTPAVVMSSDLTVENNLTVTNTVTAERFVSNTTGTPEIESASNLNLTAGNAVVVTSSPLRLASFTTTERNALAAQNGDMIYNTTDNKLQGYQNGGWINLDGTV